MKMILPEGAKHLVALVDGACATSAHDFSIADKVVETLRAQGSKAWAVGGIGDLAELTSAETLAIRNGYQTRAVKSFPNNEKNRAALFAMIENGYIDTPVPADQAPASGTEQTPPAPIVERGTKMATKKKAAKKKAAKKTTTPRVKAPAFIEIGNGAPPAGTTCGLYIRSLIMKGATTEDILAKVKKHYPDSTAKGSDVSWNRQKLRADGVKNVPDAVRPAAKE